MTRLDWCRHRSRWWLPARPTVVHEGRTVPPQGASFLFTLRRVFGDLAEEIHSREIDDFAPAPAENCSQHEETEAFGLLESNGRWHGELLPAHEDFDQSRSVMLESLRNHGLYLIRCFGREPQEIRGLRHLCETWVVQVGSKIDDAGGFHFQLHKRQRVVLEDNHLDRRFLRSRHVTVGQVAQATGFADQSHFTKVFRRLVGITPVQFRAGD
jgi:hypothetical protein